MKEYLKQMALFPPAGTVIDPLPTKVLEEARELLAELLVVVVVAEDRAREEIDE
jgi:hypothetical protein